MKKTKLFRLLFVLAVATALIAATAAAVSAATINKNDADYKYSKEYQHGIVISYTKNVIDNPVLNNDLYVRIELPDGVKFETFGDKYLTKFTCDGRDIRNQSWDFSKGNVAYGVLKLKNGNELVCGQYLLTVIYIGKYEGSDVYSRVETKYYAGLVPPKQISITTYPNKAVFNTNHVRRFESGEYTLVTANGNTDAILNGMNENVTAKRLVLKPGKKYNFELQATDRFNITGHDEEDTQIYGPVYTLKNVPMGPATKPVIKSVKVSNVRSERYFNTSEWRYKYRTKYKITVTLSKKAANTKGIYLTVAGTNGFTGEYKTIKGTGKTFTTTITKNAPTSQKGKKVKVSVRTYSDNKYKAYSHKSKAKTVTLR